jgi:CheY-like chemotaxis protein
MATENGSVAMRVLVAEDEKVTRLRLERLLTEWGFEVETVVDGQAAWERLCSKDPPRLCIIDWMMPTLKGTEVCRLVREKFPEESFYLIILTARQGVDNLIEGLGAGADDYVAKPFIGGELHSRINVGVRVLGLEATLAQKVRQLELALEDVKQLSELLPICSYCHKIRNDKDYWEQVDSYLARRSNIAFSHSICPSCYEQHVRPMLDIKPGG